MKVDSSTANNKQIFQTLCDGISARVRDGSVSLIDGVDLLFAKSLTLKLDTDEAQAMMADAFKWRLARG